MPSMKANSQPTKKVLLFWIHIWCEKQWSTNHQIQNIDQSHVSMNGRAGPVFVPIQPCIFDHNITHAPPPPPPPPPSHTPQWPSNGQQHIHEAVIKISACSWLAEATMLHFSTIALTYKTCIGYVPLADC